MTRVRTEPVRPRAEYAAELRLKRARLAVEATDFFLLSAVDWFEVAGDRSVFACADEFAPAGADVSDVATGAFSGGFDGAAGCG
jgi:hypothetical protein